MSLQHFISASWRCTWPANPATEKIAFELDSPDGPIRIVTGIADAKNLIATLQDYIEKFECRIAENASGHPVSHTQSQSSSVVGMLSDPVSGQAIPGESPKGRGI